MKITPLDIQQVGFKVKFRGYDRQEVDSFLDSVMEEYEGLIRENNRLQEKLGDSEGQIAELRKKEATLNSTLMNAQDLVENMKQGAQKDADLVIKEAELKAEGFTHLAREELSSIKRDILDLQKQKMLFLEKIRSMMRVLERLLELEDEEDERDKMNAARKDLRDDDRDDNVRILKPKT